MKTPQIAPMAGMTPLGIKLPAKSADQKTIAERQWQKPKLAPKPQRPCDHGLFSDEANQLDLVEMCGTGPFPVKTGHTLHKRSFVNGF